MVDDDIFETVPNKKEVKIYFHELMCICHPTEANLIQDDKIVEMILKLQEKINQLFFRTLVHLGMRMSRKRQIQ